MLCVCVQACVRACACACFHAPVLAADGVERAQRALRVLPPPLRRPKRHPACAHPPVSPRANHSVRLYLCAWVRARALVQVQTRVFRSFNTTPVGEQHPRPRHNGATSMQTHPAVRVGFEQATDGVHLYVFAN